MYAPTGLYLQLLTGTLSLPSSSSSCTSGQFCHCWVLDPATCLSLYEATVAAGTAACVLRLLQSLVVSTGISHKKATQATQHHLFVFSLHCSPPLSCTTEEPDSGWPLYLLFLTSQASTLPRSVFLFKEGIFKERMGKEWEQRQG